MDSQNTIIAPKTFYSTAANLMIGFGNVQHGIDSTGRVSVYGKKNIRFIEVGGTPFGMYTTNDPEEIKLLEDRCKKLDDVFDRDEFVKRSIAPERRADSAEAENQRLLGEVNRLKAMLAQQQASQPGKFPVPENTKTK